MEVKVHNILSANKNEKHKEKICFFRNEKLFEFMVYIIRNFLKFTEFLYYKYNVQL